jgi:hypothetical protein
MSGIISVLVWALAAYWEPMPLSLRWAFILGGIIGLLAAGFSAWRDMRREARPYGEGTYKHAKVLFANLAEADKAALERIAVERNLAAALVPDCGRLEQTGMVDRNLATAMLSLHPEYRLIVPRLVKEWRSGRLVHKPSPPAHKPSLGMGFIHKALHEGREWGCNDRSARVWQLLPEVPVSEPPPG